MKLQQARMRSRERPPTRAPAAASSTSEPAHPPSSQSQVPVDIAEIKRQAGQEATEEAVGYLLKLEQTITDDHQNHQTREAYAEQQFAAAQLEQRRREEIAMQNFAAVQHDQQQRESNAILNYEALQQHAETQQARASSADRKIAAFEALMINAQQEAEAARLEAAALREEQARERAQIIEMIRAAEDKFNKVSAQNEQNMYLVGQEMQQLTATVRLREEELAKARAALNEADRRARVATDKPRQRPDVFDISDKGSRDPSRSTHRSGSNLPAEEVKLAKKPPAIPADPVKPRGRASSPKVLTMTGTSTTVTKPVITSSGSSSGGPRGPGEGGEKEKEKEKKEKRKPPGPPGDSPGGGDDNPSDSDGGDGGKDDDEGSTLTTVTRL